jgi:hypothetical protein
MERQIVGLLVEGDYDGNINIIVERYPIEKETPKMFYPDLTNARVGRRAIRYLTQLRKAELGFIESNNTQRGEFSFQTHNVFSDEAEVERAKEKLLAKAEEEINYRLNRTVGWKKNFDALRAGGHK